MQLRTNFVLVDVKSIKTVETRMSLHENVAFSVCTRMCNAAYFIFIVWNSISGLYACYHFRLNISCEVAVTVGSHPKKYQVTF